MGSLRGIRQISIGTQILREKKNNTMTSCQLQVKLGILVSVVQILESRVPYKSTLPN
jgi:hypothetical protein